MSRQKVVIIGIDGGEITTIKEMIKRGVMPNMKKIIQHSMVRKMDCYIQGLGQGWASFMTGKSPVKHGIFYWKAYLGAASSDIKDRKIWDILGENGIACGVINLSYTFPPKPINGFMISGLGGGLFATKDVVYSYPENLIDELEKHAKGYIWGVKRGLGKISTQKKYFQDVIKMTEKRGEACLYVLKKYNPDFFLVVFRGADAIQHSFWHFLDQDYRVSEKFRDLTPLINQYYNTLDTYVGKIWAENDNANKFIISDHGFGPTKSIFYINEYLSNEGFLIKKRDIKSKVGNVYFNKAKNTIGPLYQNYLEQYKLFSKLNKLRKKRMPKIQVAIDWNQTTAYARCPYGICFNSKIVNTKEKENEIFHDIKERLLSLSVPETGKKIIKNVYRKNSLNIQRNEDAAPDLIFEMADETIFIFPDIILDREPVIFQNLDRVDIGEMNGSHRRNGLLIIDRKSGYSSSKICQANIADISATVLKIFDVAIPDDIDGRSILS